MKEPKRRIKATYLLFFMFLFEYSNFYLVWNTTIQALQEVMEVFTRWLLKNSEITCSSDFFFFKNYFSRLSLIFFSFWFII